MTACAQCGYEAVIMNNESPLCGACFNRRTGAIKSSSAAGRPTAHVDAADVGTNGNAAHSRHRAEGPSPRKGGTSSAGPSPAQPEPPGPGIEHDRSTAAHAVKAEAPSSPVPPSYLTEGDVRAERDRDLREGAWREVTLGEVRDLFPAGVYERQVDGGVALVGLDGGPAVHHLGVASTQSDVLRALGNEVIRRRGAR